jgi:sulfatase maturation enzyme AslB (radical SAM superfamily)
MKPLDQTPLVEIEHLDHLWFQVAGTRCNLTCNHCFISCSPHNRSFGFMSLSDVLARLKESSVQGVKEFYFTGGEPFLNPDLVPMLEATLEIGPSTVLTNATVLQPEWLDRLRLAEQRSIYSLEFRVSIDGFDAESNDPIRGEGTFDRAIQGVTLLVDQGFLPIITATRTWEADQDLRVVGNFQRLLRALGYDRPRIKILPTLKIGAEEHRSQGYQIGERVTRQMMDGFDSSQLLCHHSRIVTDRGVHVCPILIESSDALLSDSLAGSMRPYPLGHGACFTCFQYGAICSNPSSSLFFKNSG